MKPLAPPPLLLVLLSLLGACAPAPREPAAPAPRRAAAAVVLATYRGEVRAGELTLTRVFADDRVAQPLTLATLPSSASGSSGTTTAPPDSVLLHQVAPRSLDVLCNAPPYGDPGVPVPFQGVCVRIQAITGYSAREVVRTHVELTALTPGIGTYVDAADDNDFGVFATRGLWYYDRLAPLGTPGGLDRRTVPWYFATPVPGALASFAFTAVVKGELVDRVARVTPSVAGVPCDVATAAAAVSRDGRYVALVTGQNACFGAAGGPTQVLRLDRQTGAVVVVSHGAGAGATGSNGNNDSPVISGLGDIVAWRSTSTNLLPGGFDALQCADANGNVASIFARHVPSDAIYVIDIDLNTVATVPGFAAARPAISDDGSYVAFDTAAPLEPTGADANAFADVYVRDVFGGPVTLASLDNPGRTAGATAAALDSAGSVVAFESADDSLVPGDTGQLDVFAYEAATGAVRRVSVTAAGGQANGPSSAAAVAADGARVAFQSAATNLVGAATTAGRVHVYARDVGSAASLVRADGRALTAGAEANGDAVTPRLSYTGRFVTFVSTATNLDPFVAPNGIQMYATDLASATPLRMFARMLSASPGNASSAGGVPGALAWLAADGNYALFWSFNSGNLVGDAAVGPYLYVAPLR